MVISSNEIRKLSGSKKFVRFFSISHFASARRRENHDMLQRIVFLLKKGYALLVPIAELVFVGVIEISSSTVVRAGVFR